MVVLGGGDAGVAPATVTAASRGQGDARAGLEAGQYAHNISERKMCAATHGNSATSSAIPSH